ncbi:MAG: phycobiliprotein lyase [Synechococcaceae bacterium WB9_3_282]|nr:phycobiliprotein lyase [Synechococcaceae bacterium WB9_3_282]
MDQIDNALNFFRLSAGSWRSQRTSHHLLHRRAEAGGSLIEVAMLNPDDPRLAAMANLHNQNPNEVVGGCHVRWGGSMAWDKHGEAHEGESMFALIPTDTEGRQGLLLRDRGYAETAPVAGNFRLDQEGSLWLTTSYETMASEERFWFVSPNIRLRSSTVEGSTRAFLVVGAYERRGRATRDQHPLLMIVEVGQSLGAFVVHGTHSP